ncbi:MAG: DUF4249 family protein [Bacteroidetes bacterium]|nr:MAG: DUF4249 family protein [Bacteroidota bacterium]
MWLCVVIGSFGSCETYRTVDYPLPSAAPRPVAVGLWAPDQPLRIFADWTIPLQSSPLPPKGADSLQVTLMVAGGQTYPLIPQEGSLFGLVQPPAVQAGAVLTLSIDCSRCGGPWTAQDTVPAAGEIVSVSATIDSSTRSYRAELTFRAPPGSRYFGFSQVLLGPDSLPLSPAFPQGEEMRLPDEFGTLPAASIPSYSFSLAPSTYFGPLRISGLRVWLFSLSPASHAFLMSQAEYEGTYGDFLVAPVEVVSNFSHEIGFWGLYQLDSATVFFP